MNADFIIRDEFELEEMFGLPKETVKQKVVSQLDRAMNDFIARSPLVFIATCDHAGFIDVSPKGDEPGFVKIDASGELLIPERPGNKLMFSFRNLLRNSRIGLIFLIPNTRETLRIKGTASLSRDPKLLDRLSVNGKPALLSTNVEIKECFFHCGKAMIRSKLWKPESWVADAQEMISHFASKHELNEQEIASNVEQSYRDNLY